METQQEIARLIPEGNLETLTFSSDGQTVIAQTVIAQTGTRQAYVWNLPDDAQLASRLVQDLPEDIEGISLSYDGRYASFINDNESSGTLWDIEGQKAVATNISYPSFDPDGHYLSFLDALDNVIFWDIKTQKQYTLPGEFERIDIQKISSDGNLFMIISEPDVIIWDTKAEEVWNLRISAAQIENASYFSFSPNGQYLGISSESGAVLWDIATQQSVELPVEQIYDLIFSPDGRYLAMSSEAGAVLWDIATQQPVELPIDDDDIYIYSLTFSPDGRYLAISSQASAILWDIATQQPVELPVEQIDDLTFSPDGRYIDISSEVGEILWDIATQQLVELFGGDIYALLFSPDGKYIFFDSESGAGLFNIETEELTKVTEEDVDDTFFSPDSKYIFFDSESGTELLNTKTGKSKKLTEEDVDDAFFSPDSKYIFFNSESGAELLNIETEKSTRLPGKIADDFKVSPDGSMITFQDDKELILWDLTTNKEMVRVFHKGEPWEQGVAFSPNGQYWVTHGRNSLEILPLKPDKLINEACNRLPRNLTRDEWQRYLGDEPYSVTCPNLPGPAEQIIERG